MNENDPFVENIHDLVRRPGEMREKTREIILEETWGEGLAEIPVGAKIQLNLRFESIHEGIFVSATVAATMHAECGRCLTEFEKEIQVDISELFAYNITEADDYGVHGDHVNLEPPIRDAVVLALPFQPVDRPDCPGLNPETGDLKDGTEDANEDQAIDPRWATLAGFQAHNDQDA